MTKEVCKHCCNTRSPLRSGGAPVPWNMDDDMNWNKGRVWCIAGYSSLDNDNHLCKTANGPPLDCPFKMEHVILGQKL